MTEEKIMYFCKLARKTFKTKENSWNKVQPFVQKSASETAYAQKCMDEVFLLSEEELNAQLNIIDDMLKCGAHLNGVNPDKNGVDDIDRLLLSGIKVVGSAVRL